jgi:hypothetical protein
MGSDVANMMAFLRQHGDQRFCSTCLAFELKLSFEGVDSALATVGQQTAVTEGRGRCAICGRRALVTGLEPSNDRRPEERVLHFVLDHVGRFFCYVCIARLLQLNIGTVQRAVWHLRGLAEVRIDDMACSGCGRRRFVLGGVDRLELAN